MTNTNPLLGLDIPALQSPGHPIGEIRRIRANEKNWYALAFLVLWLGLWTFGGVAAIAKLLGPDPDQPKVFLLVWLGGWALGWVGVAFTMVWALVGKQTLIASTLSLVHIAQIGPFRRVRNFRAGDITNLRWVDRHRAPSGVVWTIEGPSLKFDHGAKTITVFKGISHPEAVRLIEELCSALGIARSAS